MKISEVAIKDFVVGQSVYLVALQKYVRTTDAVVTSVGNRYLYVSYGKTKREVVFDSLNNYRQHTKYSADYMLFKSKEDANKFRIKNEIIREIRSFCGYNSLSFDEIKSIASMMHIDVDKYDLNNKDGDAE